MTATEVLSTDYAAPTKARGSFSRELKGDHLVLKGQGAWVLATVDALSPDVRQVENERPKAITFDTSGISLMDTSGAWLIERLRRHADDHGIRFEVIVSPDAGTGIGLMDVLAEHEQPEVYVRAHQGASLSPLYHLGRGVTQFGRDFLMACNLIGACLQGSQTKAGKNGARRATSVVSQLDQMGRKAVPVIFVMSLLIGAILAQQGAYQLKFFGEELLTVDLVGILLLREIGVLLTAIMVAGRTGSAITAEIGTMKQREEIDALQVMGLNPIGVLILPRLIALLIALPILTLLADLAGLLGAMIVCALYVGITPDQFLAAFEIGVGGQPFIVGLVKAPVMALVIGLVAAIEGLKVGGSAESLGARTTASVVRAIFVVIFIDGLFAIFFASVGF
ncbi:MAG: ABC transporter permease [Pseudomonadota bacterium]